jgi:lipoprotein-releasing system ATP-binding protein
VTPAVELKHVSKRFPSAGGELTVLGDVSLNLNLGEALAITGPSGAGKSTLLYIMGTLEVPTAGQVRLLGQDPFSLKESDLAGFRNRHVGFVFQDHYLLPQCTVLENVLIPTLARGGGGEAEQARARLLLERVGLLQRLGHRPSELSGGERQRVAICRALINQPSLLLADEPTGNLDTATARLVGTLLLDICREMGQLLVVVTHSMELADRLPRRARLVDGALSFE